MDQKGGEGGGKIIAANTPEKISTMETPTGIAIHEALNRNVKAKIKLALEISKENRKRKKERTEEEIREITVENAEENNLKRISASIPREQITVCTGPSGSGKTSFAIDTIYAEGQRRYIESLSPYARQFVKQMPKPKVGHVEGLSPAIAIEQKAHAGNPRSTIGTMTEIYDYLRILYARIGIPHCPETGEVIKAISKDHVADRILSWNEGEKIQILASIDLGRNTSFLDIINRLRRQGYVRIRLNKEFYDLDQEIPFDPKRKNELCLVIDRLVINPNIGNRLLEAIENGAEIGQNKLIVIRSDKDIPFNLSFAVESTGKSYPEITPHTFSFNTAEGMCIDCQGLGFQYGANLMQKSEILNHSFTSVIKALWMNKGSKKIAEQLSKLFEKEGINPHTPLAELPTKQLQFLMQGSPPDVWYRSSEGFEFRWIGLNSVLAKIGRNGRSPLKESVLPLLDTHDCISCEGSRLNPLARNVKIGNLSISDLCRTPLDQCLEFVKKINIPKEEHKTLGEIKEQLISRVTFLCEVGLHYLSLERKAPTLSGGETQRIRLARQLGSGLTGVLYVLDEPTIGLHPRDNDRLNQALQQLKKLGNTLLLVEHDPLTVKTADYLIDFGPKSGEHGGHITARGTVKQILKNNNSLTGQYLSGKKKVSVPEKRRKPSGDYLVIKNAKKHNLKNISVKIPVGLLTCITGVSGSGKSTLLYDIILPAMQELGKEDKVKTAFASIAGIDFFNKVISIDQNPIGLTARSDVGTYVDLLTRMREFFVQLPAAKIKGLQTKHFSYNHRRGMCTACWGMGYKKVEMHFLPPIEVVCEECQGLRLNPTSLEVIYAGKNFGQHLNTTIDEARHTFENFPRITRILDTLISVGLGYLKLGQQMATLSGGEAQRIKLSRELAKRSTGQTLYLLDEPTTGLHSDDIAKLVGVLQKLVTKGNTMVIIEHNTDMILNADYVIDLGPDAGDRGGKVVCTGEPEQIAKCKESFTGKYLYL